MSENGYAKLVSWTVENFMSIKKATCEFDGRNIINLKGYNDSGKSAMLRALDVLFFNLRPNAQVNFINDNADYFRIVARFDDGVVILRDKYSNGQSLYEMYKGDDLLYSTKVKGVLSKVSDVPEPIQNYLGLIEYDGTLLNSRTCFEKQLLVQTSGGDNYKLLNAVLKSEELATASNLLNEDKNKLGSDINSLNNSITSYKEMLTQTDGLTEELVAELELTDGILTKHQEQELEIENVCKVKSDYTKLNVPEEVPTVATATQYKDILVLNDTNKELDTLQIYPEIGYVDADRLFAITALTEQSKELVGEFDQPEVPLVDESRYSAISELNNILGEFVSVSKKIEELGQDSAIVKTQLTDCMQQAEGKYVQCPNCGELIEL